MDLGTQSLILSYPHRRRPAFGRRQLGFLSTPPSETGVASRTGSAENIPNPIHYRLAICLAQVHDHCRLRLHVPIRLTIGIELRASVPIGQVVDPCGVNNSKVYPHLTSRLRVNVLARDTRFSGGLLSRVLYTLDPEETCYSASLQ